MNTALINIPRCPAHDVSMELQIPRTKEQRFIGTMYRCPYCGNSFLFSSKELKEQLKQQEGNEHELSQNHDRRRSASRR